MCSCRAGNVAVSFAAVPFAMKSICRGFYPQPGKKSKRCLIRSDSPRNQRHGEKNDYDRRNFTIRDDLFHRWSKHQAIYLALAYR